MGLIFTNIPELEGSNTEIVLSNLTCLENELEVIAEKRMAHLCELAGAIVGDGEDLDIIKSIILSIRSEGLADSGNIIDENRSAADAMFGKISLIERLIVFKEIFEKIDLDKHSFDSLLCVENASEAAQGAKDRIAYLKNSYNDIAYMQFSSLLHAPRASYFGSIADVCESVYNGECEFCILPIETSSDGRLISFYELIMKYGFKITAVYDLYGNGNDYTRYALLGRSFSFRDRELRKKARNRYFEFLIPSEDTVPLDDLLSATSFCRLKLRRIDTLNMRDDDGTKSAYTCPVLRTDGADIKTFLAFLAIDCPGFIPLGLYIQI